MKCMRSKATLPLCRCLWGWLWSNRVASMHMGRLCQEAMLRQIRSGASMTGTQGQLRRLLSLRGMAMGPMTPKHACSTPAFQRDLAICKVSKAAQGPL